MTTTNRNTSSAIHLVPVWLTLMLLCLKASARAQTTNATQSQSNSPATRTEISARPSFKQLRADEDWSLLRDPQRRTETLDALKYIPISQREGWYLSFGGEIRPYYERYQHEDWGTEPEDETGFLLQRYMVHADLHLGAHVRFFGQLKSGIETGRRGGPRPPDEDKLDVHQAFVQFSAQPTKEALLQLRIGRQELSFGSSRLVSTREGPNVRQSFDAVRLSLHARQWTLDAFASKPVQTKRGFFDDAANHAQTFWGIYAVRPWAALPLKGRVDLYYLGLAKKRARFAQGAGHERRHTIGARVWNPRATWDYNVELVYQFGEFVTAQTSAIRAWTAASDTGYTWRRLPLNPRLGLKANITSGDQDPADNKLETFNPLFPKGAYFGQLSPVGPLNHRDLHPNVELTLWQDIALTADWVFYWRQSTRDAVYGIPGNLQRRGDQSAARFIGQQPGLEISWQANHHTTFTINYARFLAGRFLHETPPGRDITYFAAWLTYKF
ncbi:MAG: alginate export family protein [Acidobacteriota bacterium]